MPALALPDVALRGSSYLVLLGSIALLGGLAAVFAATAMLLRWRNHRSARRWARLEARWQPALLAVLSGERTPEEVAAAVPPAERFYFVEMVFRFARRVRGRDRERLARAAAPFLAAVAERIRHRDAERRARAVETLALIGGESYTAQVAAALDDAAPLVAMTAARALARVGGAVHAQAVVGRLHRFAAWSPRQLTTLLVSMGSAAVPALRTALADPCLPAAVRTIAADALARLGDPGSATTAAALLHEAEQPGTDRELLAAALRLLAEVGDTEHAAAVRALADSPDAVVRAHALRTLAALPGRAGDVERLRAALDDPSRWVAIQAARSLGELGATQALVNVATTDAHPRADLARQVIMEQHP